MRTSMTAILVLAFVILLGAPATFSKEPIGRATCAETKEGIGCELKWEFPDSVEHSYSAQKWDRDSKSWVDIDSIQSHRFSNTRLGSVEPGRLYKAAACEAAGCSSSNAVWAPDWTPVEDIPDVIHVDVPNQPDRGMALSITKFVNGKPMEPRMIIAQHNMYLAVAEAIEFHNSSEEMPKMEKPPSYDPAPRTVEEMVLHNVHKVYEELREEVLRERQ